jgi:F0F1-type ATP synthase delta subunit
MAEGGATPSKAVHALRELLASHGREALLPHIARAFARLAEQQSSRNDIVLTIAHEHDEKDAQKEAMKFVVEMDSKSARGGSALGRDLKTQVDDSIIGGWRLEGRGVLVDASYKQQLLELFNRVTTAQ